VLRTDIHAVVQRLGESSGTFSRVPPPEDGAGDRGAERGGERATADRMVVKKGAVRRE
jgi:hypothetical protein